MTSGLFYAFGLIYAFRNSDTLPLLAGMGLAWFIGSTQCVVESRVKARILAWLAVPALFCLVILALSVFIAGIPRTLGLGIAAFVCTYVLLRLGLWLFRGSLRSNRP